MPKKKKSFAKKGMTTTPRQELPIEDHFPTLAPIGQALPPVVTTGPAITPVVTPIASTSQMVRSVPIGDPIVGPSSPQSTTCPQTPTTGVDTTVGQTEEKQKSETKEELTKKLKQNLSVDKKVARRPFPRRPGPLTTGQTVQLLTNHFLLTVGKPSQLVYHYDIEIEKVLKKSQRDTNLVDRDVEEGVLKDKRNIFARKIATKINRRIFETMIRTYSKNPKQVFYGINPVFDGQKNMFTSKLLMGTVGDDRPKIQLSVALVEEGRPEGTTTEYIVDIKLTDSKNTLDLSLLDAYHRGKTCDEEVVMKCVLFINTLLRHNATMKWTPIGQSIFEPNKPGQAIGNYLSLSYGFYTSVRNVMAGPTLNVDRSAATFYNSEIPIIRIIGHIIGKTDVPKLNDFQIKKIKREFSGLQVEARHIKYGNYYRKYRILGVSKKTAKEIKFNWIEKIEGKDVNRGETTIEKYFQIKYKTTLRYPQMPCLEVGNIQNKIYLPLEVCSLVPQQRLRRSLTNAERSEVTRVSGVQTPRDRLEMCRKYVVDQFKVGGTAETNKPFLSEFEINVSDQLMEVEGKVLQAPVLRYLNGKTVSPRDGEWEMFRTGAQFLKAGSLQNWIIINISFSPLTEEMVKEFVKDFRNQALEMGLGFANQKIIARIPEYHPKTTFENIKRKIETLGFKVDMILFFTPLKSHQFSDDIRSEIKRLGDVQLGVATQCVNIANIWPPKGRNVRWNRSYLRQLMLKVNVKLGGINVALKLDPTSMPSIFKEKGVMIVGADVNHPAPGDRIAPSIAAMTGSYDNDYTNYYTTSSMQKKSRLEMINRFDEMIVELLKYYHYKQGSLPQRIVIYRDGVSEGQFQHCIDNEFQLLLKSFKSQFIVKIDAKYRPKITFIIVQKRHHTRLMTKDRHLNVPPGTVVDNRVTHKTDFDFYLCSHFGRIGTSRSAHYYVLADENGFSTNDMCKMTYYMCHIYQRTTKSVSIPAPVYYADLAATRAKELASAPTGTESDTSSIGTSASGDDRREREELAIESLIPMIKVNENQRQKLYFC